MDILDPKKLKRDANKIKQAMTTIGDTIVVNKNLRVIYPESYESKKLAILGNPVRIVNIYAVLDDDGNYAVSNLPIFMELTPSNIKFIEVNGVVNKVLEFPEGTNFTNNNKMVVNNKFLFDLFNEFYINGKIPWFMEYDDIIDIFKQTDKYANSNLGDNPIVTEILASIVAKNPNDKSKLYRELLKDKKVLKEVHPEYVGLLNLFYTFDNTVSKLTGSYYSKGVISAIVNKEKDTTKIEEILRA